MIRWALLMLRRRVHFQENYRHWHRQVNRQGYESDCSGASGTEDRFENRKAEDRSS
jgi:hypothetical protein